MFFKYAISAGAAIALSIACSVTTALAKVEGDRTCKSGDKNC